MTLTFNPRRTMVMADMHAKDQGQKSVGPKCRVETNGLTDGHDRLHYLAC